MSKDHFTILESGRRVERLEFMFGGDHLDLSSVSLTGAAGRDVLDGQGGNDTLRGEGGDDVYFLRAGGGVRLTRQGGDLLVILLDGKGADTHSGNWRGNAIEASGGGNDCLRRLEGGSGNDWGGLSGCGCIVVSREVMYNNATRYVCKV